MAVRSIRVSLRAWIPGGRVAYEDFFPALAIPDSDRFAKSGAAEGGQATALVRFAELKISDFQRRPDPWDSFEQESIRCLSAVSEWLRERPKAAFVGFGERGIRVDVLLQMWIDGNQLDLVVPPVLASVCGDYGIGIVVVTNE